MCDDNRPIANDRFCFLSFEWFQICLYGQCGTPKGEMIYVDETRRLQTNGFPIANLEIVIAIDHTLRQSSWKSYEAVGGHDDTQHIGRLQFGGGKNNRNARSNAIFIILVNDALT